MDIRNGHETLVEENLHVAFTSFAAAIMASTTMVASVRIRGQLMTVISRDIDVTMTQTEILAPRTLAARRVLSRGQLVEANTYRRFFSQPAKAARLFMKQGHIKLGFILCKVDNVIPVL